METQDRSMRPDPAVSRSMCTTPKRLRSLSYLKAGEGRSNLQWPEFVKEKGRVAAANNVMHKAPTHFQGMICRDRTSGMIEPVHSEKQRVRSLDCALVSAANTYLDT